MTLSRGQSWGAPGALPASGVVVTSDAEAAEVVRRARAAGRPVPVLGLLGGDLCRTLGGLGDERRLRSEDAMTFPVDLGRAEVDGSSHLFVAHLVARGPWWRGRAWVAMNAAWLGDWNLGPRAHPGDGLLDVVDLRVPAGQRRMMRRRLPMGAHVPHPAVVEHRVPAASVELERPLGVHLDGRPLGPGRRLRVEVEPDAIRVVV